MIYAQTASSYVIDTIAGTLPPQEGIPAVDAVLYTPPALAVGHDGVIYVSDILIGIRSITPDGSIFDLTGPPPSEIAVDPSDAAAGERLCLRFRLSL